MRKLPNETLRHYAERYWQLFNEIPGIDEYWAARTFKNGLESGSKILDELAIRPPHGMGELMRVVEQFCALEEFYADRAAQGIPSSTTCLPTTTPQLQTPIVLVVGPGSKRPRPEETPKWTITFTERDLEFVHTPHSDALVVTVQIGVHDVKRILIDQGSSAEVMYYDLFKKLDLPESALQPAEVPLIGFNGTPVWPLGRIFLPVVASSKTLTVEFIVVNVPSLYNAILGRAWLHDMQAIASTYHQVVRFIGSNGRQEDLRGDQVASKKCYISAVHNSAKAKQVQWVEVPDMAVIDDVGQRAEDKTEEDLIPLPLNEDGSRFFLIASSLSDDDREETFRYLKDNIEVFAWTPNEMPGVDPDFICHSLNVRKDAKPVVQKARRSATEHADAVVEQVKRLLEANAIQEVEYPTWLSNTVVVKKKNGKWRVCVDYTNLNYACPKDWFPLPKINQLVDATVGHARLSFLDAYRGYHQIAMDPDDMEKTAFITPYGIFCYRVMPFGLKNSCATFNRAIFKMMHAKIGHTLEAYVDDLVVKSQKESNHLQELKEIFDILKLYKLRLNPEKCAFGISAGKFLGHLVTRRGIEADPNQIKAITDLRPPRTIKEVQQLTGMAAALNRFISKSSDKCHAFFNALKGKSRRSFEWTPECDSSLAELKEYLSSGPLLVKPKEFETLYLYLAVSAHAVSSALVRREGAEEKPIYFTSKTLLPNTPSKLSFGRQISNRVSKWAVELANFDISFEPRTAIKGQVLADFIAELTPADTAALNAPTPPDVAEHSSVTMPWHLFQGETWRLNVDGASNSNGAGAGVVLVSPCGTLPESSLTIDFPATNNEAEYEALLAGLRSAIAMKVTNLIVYCDSRLIVNQVLGDYEARDP
ncbi:uncharacterized protein LOC131306832 [Rhododendron vialii]|uniref:uncharacterized protein LOC131306832 n=1 Tax=Rhododendron vialii TaxID=182163 RepID=UPI00265D9555|nr:uncharacterized protein LOC131306832 [Rhododendron vialii]